LCGALAGKGLYGTRIHVCLGALSELGLVDNLADFLVIQGDAREVLRRAPRGEILRVIHPGARAYLGAKAAR
jgi:hypothetical protein